MTIVSLPFRNGPLSALISLFYFFHLDDHDANYPSEMIRKLKIDASQNCFIMAFPVATIIIVP